MREMSANEYLFLRWMSEQHPRLLAAAEERRAGLHGAVDSITAALNSVMQTASSGLTAYVQGKQQLSLLKTNIARAKQGLPPLTDAGLAYSVPPDQLNAREFPTPIPWGLIALGVVGVYLVTRE